MFLADNHTLKKAKEPSMSSNRAPFNPTVSIRHALLLACFFFFLPNVAAAQTCHLSVDSSPDWGVQIGISPDSSGGYGVTPFSRSYQNSITVALTAPASFQGKRFKNWSNGSTQLSTSVSMEVQGYFCRGDGPITAYYQTARTLTVTSAPDSAVTVQLSKADLDGKVQGATAFTAVYPDRTAVTVKAPRLAFNKSFVRWWKNGVAMDSTCGSTTCDAALTMDQDQTLTASYDAGASSFVLDVSSQIPASGVAIEVIPNDSQGNGSGTTPFSRLFAGGTEVTVSAPLTHQTMTFVKWLSGSADYSSNPTISIVVSQDAALKAVYQTPTAGNHAPQVTLSVSPAEGKPPLAVTLTAQASDADDDALTFSWSFGDGQESSAASAAEINHTYEKEGDYKACVVARDGKGGVVQSCTDISVRGSPTTGTNPNLVGGQDASAGGCGALSGSDPAAALPLLLVAALFVANWLGRSRTKQ
jgi:PKD repeat protein